MAKHQKLVRVPAPKSIPAAEPEAQVELKEVVSSAQANLRTVLRPREDEVIIRKHGEGRTSGGIILPNVNRTDGFTATVVMVSDGFYAADGTWCTIRDLKPGDVVLVRGNRGTRFTVPNGPSDEVFWYVSCHDIVVVFDVVEVDIHGQIVKPEPAPVAKPLNEGS